MSEISTFCDAFYISLMIAGNSSTRLSIGLSDRTWSATLREDNAGVVADLLGCCNAIIDNTPHNQPFHTDPVDHVWTLTPDPVMRHLVRLQLSETASGNSGSTGRNPHNARIDFVTKRKYLVASIMMELWKIRLLYADAAFQKERPAFPHSLFSATFARWTQSNIATPLSDGS
jgi:hypothetical protein